MRRTSKYLIFILISVLLSSCILFGRYQVGNKSNNRSEKFKEFVKVEKGVRKADYYFVNFEFLINIDGNRFLKYVGSNKKFHYFRILAKSAKPGTIGDFAILKRENKWTPEKEHCIDCPENLENYYSEPVLKWNSETEEYELRNKQ